MTDHSPNSSLSPGMEAEPHARDNYIQWRKQERRKRIRLAIIACLFLIPFLTSLERWVFPLGQIPFPVSGNLLVFIIISVNIILLMLMVFLVLRNLAELVFERRQELLGTKLRTKLVISFVSLSLIPTTLLFFIALQFVSTSMDYWFNINVEQALEESLTIAQNVYQNGEARIRQRGEALALWLTAEPEAPLAPNRMEFLQREFGQYELAGLEIISAERSSLLKLSGSELAGQELPEPPPELLRRALAGEHALVARQPIAGGELVRALTPAWLGRAEGKADYVLLTGLVIPSQRLAGMALVAKGIDGYRQLMLLKKPIKSSLLVTLLIVTLLIIFSAIWFGFYVAGSLTRPIHKLAQGIRRVAEGELDFILERESGDEMGTLVDSFNRMTGDLRGSQQQLEDANLALRERNQEIEQRRRYTEIILQNITAGVIAIDGQGKIVTLNRFAEELLQVRRENILGKSYSSILRLNHLTILENFFQELQRSGKPSIQRPLRFSVNNESYSLRVNFTKLEDEEHNQLGVVIVFDNLTELEKIQRMAAWREVARRIAHEVKNPLTPIQLSAQRLRKRYLSRLAADGEVFDLCTATIINQVDELKKLVSEFSNFARMPAVAKSMNSLMAMSREVVALYREAHKEIEFVLLGAELEKFSFDQTQLRRVLVNLLDNAVAVLPQGGRVEVEVRQNPGEKLAFLEVRDDGPGVRDSDKLSLFEPYFSTKKSGTGLGLAIASTVVADHGGYIRVKNNHPRGARFVVELPMVSA